MMVRVVSIARYTDLGYFCPLLNYWFRVYRAIRLETFCSLN